MAKKKKRKTMEQSENLRLAPEARLCPQYDAVSIRKYPVPSVDEMGMRVRDNCAEENIR